MKKEHIILDAQLLHVLGNTAFRAVLSNGHEFVAILDDSRNLAVGDYVQVRLSPFDFSKGWIS